MNCNKQSKGCRALLAALSSAFLVLMSGCCVIQGSSLEPTAPAPSPKSSGGDAVAVDPQSPDAQKPKGAYSVAEIYGIIKADPDFLRGRSVSIWACQVDGVCGMSGLTDHSNLPAWREVDRIRQLNYGRRADDQLPYPQVGPGLLVSWSRKRQVIGAYPGKSLDAPVPGLFTGHFYGTAEEVMCGHDQPNGWQIFVVERIDWLTAAEARPN